MGNGRSKDKSERQEKIKEIGGVAMERKNTAKLIRHKRKQRNLLLDLLVGVAGGAVFAAGTLLILVLYCYMRTA